MTDAAEPGNPTGLSINDYCALLPKRRWSHEAKSKLLYMPRNGMVLVPFEMVRGGGWNAVVAYSDHPSYQPDGYSVFVSEMEIETAIEVEWSPDNLKLDQVRRESTLLNAVREEPRLG